MYWNQDFIRGSTDQQSRFLTWVGVGSIAAIAVTAGAFAVHQMHPSAPDGVLMSIDVPYVAPGVAPGTKLLLRGQRVGEVVDMDRSEGGAINLNLALDENQTDGLTDSFDLDFRPENYFGSTAVTLAANPGGGPLRSGSHLTKTPVGDFTMSTMLEQGSIRIDGSLTNDMVSGLDDTVHYMDGLTSWIETAVVVSDRIAKSQQQLPSELLGKFNDITAASPAFVDQLAKALNILYHSAYNRMPDGSLGLDDAFIEDTNTGLSLASSKLFGQAGTLLASHGDELVPLTSTVKSISDLFPHLESGINPAQVRELRQRVESAFTDTGDGKELQLRVVLDNLPALGSALGGNFGTAEVPR